MGKRLGHTKRILQDVPRPAVSELSELSCFHCGRAIWFNIRALPHQCAKGYEKSHTLVKMKYLGQHVFKVPLKDVILHCRRCKFLYGKCLIELIESNSRHRTLEKIYICQRTEQNARMAIQKVRHEGVQSQQPQAN